MADIFTGRFLPARVKPREHCRPIASRRPWRAPGGALIAALVMLMLPVVAHASVPISASRSAQGSPARGDSASQPEAPSVSDSRALFAAVVRLDARAPREAPSSATLGSQRSGTGVVIDSRTVLTIGYLVLEADSVDIITLGGRRIPGSVTAYDHQTGFGLVRAAVPLESRGVALGDSDAARERSRVLTLGHGESEITELMVLSRKPFTAGWEYLIDRPIYTYPPVNNWSGAALFSPEGRLIGIGSLVVNDAATERSGVPGNLYVPVNLLKPILADLQSVGRRTRDTQPWLGMNTEWIQGNLMVSRVQAGGPAELAGIGPGDIVVGLAGERVRSQADFYRRLIALGPAGVEIGMRLLKSGELRNINVKSIDRADFLMRARGI